MKDEKVTVNALRAWIEEARDVLGYFNPDLWLFSKRENPLTAETILQKALAGKGKANFLFLTDRGLNLNFRLSEDVLSIWISGWGCDDSPATFLILTMLLKKYDFLPDEKEDGQTAPLSDEWLKNHFEDLGGYGNWVREHPELLPKGIGEYQFDEAGD